MTGTIDLSKLKGVVSGRFLGDIELSGSVLFVSYSHVTRQWYWVYPGGEEKIDEPQMLFLDDAWAVVNRLLTPSVKPLIPRKRDQQLNLFDRSAHIRSM